MKKNGFTIVEGLMVVAILAILAAIFIPAIMNYTKTKKLWTPASDTVCVGGYQHVVSPRGTYSQLINNRGEGIPCE